MWISPEPPSPFVFPSPKTGEGKGFPAPLLLVWEKGLGDEGKSANSTMHRFGKESFQAHGKTVGVDNGTLMRSTFSQAIKIVFSPETILPFLVGSVFLAVFGNAVYDILKNIFGTTTPDLVKIAAIALLILVAAVLVVWWTITQRLSRLPIDVPFEVRQKALDRKYKGLILLVSNLEACRVAIEFHRPLLERCWLVCSSTSLEKAQELQRQFPKMCIDPPIAVNDVYDPILFRDQINAIYETRLPQSWQDTEVISDYTGMTVHASVGMVLACLEKNRPLQYTPPNLRQGKIIGSLNPIRVTLGFRSNLSSELINQQKTGKYGLLNSIKRTLGI